MFLGGTLVLMGTAVRGTLPVPAPVYFGALGYMSLTYLLALITANQMTRGLPTARRLGMLTGILHLPMMPLFTPIGVAAVCVLAMPQSEEILRQPSAPPWARMSAVVPGIALLVYRSQQPR